MRKKQIVVEGKALPHSEDVEQIVLGTIIIDGSVMDRISKDFSINLFYNQENIEISKTIIDLYKASLPIDLVTLVKKLKDTDRLEQAGGINYVSNLSTRVSGSANIEFHIKILQEESLRRKVILISNKAIVNSFDDTNDIFEVFSNTQHQFDDAIKNVVNYEIKKVGQIHSDVISQSISVLKSGTKSGVPTGLRLLDNVTNGWQKSDLIVLAGRPGMGKELKNSSLIYTPNGFTTIGQIKLGDSILGSDGYSYNVIGVFPQGRKDVYRVHFDDGTYVDAGLEHQWEISTRKSRKTKEKSSVVMTTKDLMVDTILPGNRKNYAIRYCKPLHFTEQPITMHPYLLGFLIGDGCFKNTGIGFFNTEKDLISKIQTMLPDNVHITSSTENDYRISRKSAKTKVNPIFKQIYDLGLHNCHSFEKFIPKNYLYNTIEIRTQVLQGLVDTDGFIATNGKNAIEYSTTSHQLCLDIVELVRGLGGKCTYKEKQGAYRKDGGRIVTRKYYRMYLSLPSEIMPVTSKKHLSKYNPNKRFDKKYITKIEKMDYQDEMTCISVDAPDCLYITDGHTLTHNTSAVVSMAIHPAVFMDIPVAIFSLEMSSEQLVARMQSQFSMVNVSKIVKKQLTEDEIVKIERSTEKFRESPMYVDDTPNISLMDLKGKVRKLVRENEVKLVIIDYLQLMRSGLKTQSREQEISEISRGLKALAKELSIPIIALSQLSRSVEQRGGDKKPLLSDLRESGAIEQDADMVLFCWRPEYYGQSEYEVGGKTFPCEGLFMLIVAKHRNGELGEIPLKFIHEQTKVTNYEDNFTTFEQRNEHEEYVPVHNLKPNLEFSTQLSPMELDDFDTSNQIDENPF